MVRNFWIFWLGLYGNTWQMICGAFVDWLEPARTKQNSRNKGALRTKKHFFLLLCHIHEQNMHLNIFLCCHIINKCSFNIFLCLFNFPQNKANTSSLEKVLPPVVCSEFFFCLFAQHEHGWKPQFSLRFHRVMWNCILREPKKPMKSFGMFYLLFLLKLRSKLQMQFVFFSSNYFNFTTSFDFDMYLVCVCVSVPILSLQHFHPTHQNVLRIFFFLVLFKASPICFFISFFT